MIPRVLKKKTILIICSVGLIIGMFGIYQILYLQKSHSTFENYYSFRGCIHLIEKTDEYGICTTKSGQTIKIVMFEGKWYLDGDLPCGFLCF
jgi:hypothetical protein